MSDPPGYKSGGFEMTTPAEGEQVMRQLQMRTASYQLGFLGADPSGKDGLPCFVIDDKWFPKGKWQTDISSWNFQSKGIAHHSFIDMTFENDRTHDKTAVALNICPFELIRNKDFKDKVWSLFPTKKTSQHIVTVLLVGKQMLDFVTHAKALPADYDRLSFHKGEIDMTPLVLNIITSQLAMQPIASKYCSTCPRDR